MDGQSAKVNGLPKRTVFEIKDVKNMPKDRPLSHDRSISQDTPLQGLSIFRLFLIMHSLIEEQIHINVRW